MAYTSEMSFVCRPLPRAPLASTTNGGHAGFPDPFAVATLGGEQTKTTTVIKRTLNPYWNEAFDLYDAHRRRMREQ